MLHDIIVMKNSPINWTNRKDNKEMEIYERIDAIIEDGDTAVRDLAEIIGVERHTIARWRKGITPEMGIYKLAMLCRHYGVSADYILGLPKGLKWPR